MELKIVDLTLENINQFYSESEEISLPEPVDWYNRKLAWVREMLTKGFQRKIAFNKAGEKVGFIEYMPIEEALDNIIGENVNAIHCLWDNADPDRYEAKSGDNEPTRALFDVVEQESREVGRGVSFVGWRLKDFLRKRGYKITEQEEQMYFLALKAFESNQHASFLPRMRMTPQVELVEGKVVVDVFWNVYCSHCAHGFSQLEWVRQAFKIAAEEVGNVVTLREHQLGRADRVRYGIGDYIFVLINGKLWLDLCDFGAGNEDPYIWGVGNEDPERFLQTIRERVSEVQDSSLG